MELESSTIGTATTLEVISKYKELLAALPDKEARIIKS